MNKIYKDYTDKKCIKADFFSNYTHIKNPEYNLDNKEYSYEHIHKPMILGILGAIIGLKGMESCTKDFPIPEYYCKLNRLKIAIMPSKPIFHSNVETTVNSTCQFNKGNNQIINKVVLQNVRWTIYFMNDNYIDNNLWNTLCDRLIRHESYYPVYIGNNKYPLRLENVEFINLIKNEDKDIVINSLFPREIVNKNYEILENEEEEPYNLETILPYNMNDNFLYKRQWQEFTNFIINVRNTDNLYKDTINNKIIYFI